MKKDMTVKWGVEERDESLEELQAKIRKKVRLSKMVEILILAITFSVLVSTILGFMGEETARNGRLFLILTFSSALFIPAIQFVYQWASTNILWKEYLDSTAYIEPVELYDVHTMFMSTIFSSKKGWLFEKNIKNTQEQLLKLIYKGTLQGRYDLQARKYLPPSVIKRLKDERTYFLSPAPPPRDLWYQRKEYAKIRDIEACMANDFHNIDIYQFEKYVVGLLEKIGYATKTSPAHEDHGNDIVAEKGGEFTFVKVVIESPDEKIGLMEVRSAVDSMENFNTERTIIVTNATFTKTAHEVESKSHDIEMWDGEELKRLFAECYLDSTSKG